MQRQERLEVKAIELPDTELWMEKKSAVSSELWIFFRSGKGIPPPPNILLKVYASDSQGLARGCIRVTILHPFMY